MKMEDVSLSSMDNSKMEGFAQEILSDLVEDACLGLCFEVHRAVKQGYFFLDDTDQESMKDFEIVDQPGVDIFGQVYNQWKNKECVCPNCSRSIAASRFAPHLEKCLGMGRNSSRIANRRIASGNNTNKSESDQEDNDDVNDNDWSYGAEKKAKKRKSDKVFLHSLKQPVLLVSLFYCYGCVFFLLLDGLLPFWCSKPGATQVFFVSFSPTQLTFSQPMLFT
ncbi:ataxin-7-like protein 3 isoform b [Pimephales promelas]|nr:ataxin-7-like protein 3 isoform b [Pimephales promelas]KAG1960400.1 ataxin-7-like protein 3 isoform b [Pimephales promelas]KAG1960401.1 ataxin-7-like protein 3 isoform b [Pimephales promelas]